MARDFLYDFAVIFCIFKFAKFLTQSFFHAAAAESPSFSGDAQVVDLQPRYNSLVNATGCSNSTDTLSCLRGLNITELQTKSPVYTWSPCIDNDILVAPLYELYESRRFRQVPTIYGSDTDEGTKNVDKTVTPQNLDDLIRKNLGNMNDTQLDEIKSVYPESLNNVTFSGAVLNATYPGAGSEWERLGKIIWPLRSLASPSETIHYVTPETTQEVSFRSLLLNSLSEQQLTARFF